MTDPHDRSGLREQRIDIDRDWDVDYWKTTLGVERDELIAAVRAVGGDVGAVTEYLARQSASGPSS